MKIKVLLADENQLFRELLAARITETTDFDVVADFNNSIEVVEKAPIVNPDIVLTEVVSRYINGIETAKSLKRISPSVKVVALTSSIDKRYVKEMFEANAQGYLIKQCTFEELTTNLRKIHLGSKCVSPDLQTVFIDDYLERKGLEPLEKLTKRESEILKQLAEGRSIKEISEHLFISIKTAGTHKQNIFEKMGFENLAQLVKYAIKTGLVS